MIYQCPHCNQQYEIEEQHHGMFLQCEKCEKYFKVELEPQKTSFEIIEPQKTPNVLQSFISEFLQSFISEFKALCSKKNNTKKNEPVEKIQKNQKTRCPMCYGEINAEAFKCMHCGEILKTKSGRPVVDRVGYLIWGLTFGMFGAHYLYAKRTFDFIIHLVLLILVPIAALTLAKIFNFKSAFLLFLGLFEIAFAIYTMNNVVKDPNK